MTVDTGPLAYFRNPPAPPDSDLRSDISNTTGAKDLCGYIPDVYGNNAYFNTLCLPNGALSPKEIQAVIAQSDINMSGTAFPQNVYTPTTGWLAGANENTDPSVYTWVANGLQINFTGTYSMMLVINWANVAPVAGETWRSVEILVNGVAEVADARSINNNWQVTFNWNYGYVAGQVISISLSHDGTTTVPNGPQLGWRMILLGAGD